MIRKMYHTQEKWAKRMTEPQKCYKDNAWLGTAWYFWYDENDALFWGLTAKKNTGYYEVYSANVDCSNVLDTVFNEEHYLFWTKQIKKVETRYAKENKTLTLKLLNDFFVEKGIWVKFGGIMFQDISSNDDNYIIKKFQYKKRIQLAVYDKKIISNFALDFEGKCV